VTPEQRRSLRERYGFRCGYCGVHEHQIGAELTVDHFQPRSRGGTGDAGNLVYCCHACNEFKGDYWRPDAARRLLHPLLDDLDAHVSAEADGSVRGLTETGDFHIQRLHLNRPALIARRRRRRRQQAARLYQQALLDQLGELQQQFGALRAQLAALNRQPSDVSEEE
jgi:hypothetical protein